MQKHIKYIIIFMLVLVGFISCEEDYGLKDTQDQSNISLKTVAPTDAAKAFKESYSPKSGQSWITPYFQYNDSISVTNSNAQITVIPAVIIVPNTYSRLFTLEINSEVKTVVYNMFPSAQSSSTSFYGGVIITEVDGDIISAFKIENNNFTAYYDVVNHYETLSILNLINKNGGGSKNGCPDDDPDCLDFDGGELDEVVVTVPPNDGLSMGIVIIFVPEFTLGDDSGGVSPIPPGPSPSEPSAGGDSTNQDGCGPGKIKDDNGDCVDPPVEVECDEANGFYADEDGNCVKDPCAEINNLLADTAYLAKLAELNTSGNTNNTDEQGYGYHNDNGYLQMQTASDGHSVSYAGFDLNEITGFIHTHPCGQVDTGTGSSTTLVSSIPMPSPTVILAFRRLLSRALENGNNLQDVYMTVITCHGIFDLKYPGDGSNLANWIMDEDDYMEYFEDEDNPVLAFKKYLDEVVINTAVIYSNMWEIFLILATWKKQTLESLQVQSVTSFVNVQ